MNIPKFLAAACRSSDTENISAGINKCKFALLKYTTENIGDEIQSIAACRFLPKVDYLIDRDRIDAEPVDSKTKIILNGWFTDSPENWPVKNKNIIPLFISFHLSDEYESSFQKLPDDDSIDYYKKHTTNKF